LHRLAQVIVHANGEAALGLALDGIGGEGDDRHAGLAGFFGGADGGGQLVAVHRRHMQVGEQDGVIAAQPALQRLAAIVGDVGGLPEQHELLQDDFLVDLVVFGDQDQAALPARILAGQRRFRFDIAVFIFLSGLFSPPGGNRHRIQKRAAMHHLGVQANQIGCHDPALPASAALDGDKANIQV